MFRSYALTLAGILGAYLLGGILWGAFLRPGMTGVKVADGLVPGQDPGTSPQFIAYAWFIIGTVVLALAAAILVHTITRRGLGMMLWVILLCLVGGFVFHVVGDITVMAVHPTPDISPLAEGDTVSVIPRISPTSAYVAGPFIAGLAYWIGMVLDADIVGMVRRRGGGPGRARGIQDAADHRREKGASQWMGDDAAPAAAEPVAPGKSAPRRIPGGEG